MGVFVDLDHAVGDGGHLLLVREAGSSVQNESALHFMADQQVVDLFDQVEAQDDVFAFGNAVVGAHGGGEEIHIGLLHEFQCLLGTRVKLGLGDDLVLGALNVADLAFHNDPVFVRDLHHFPGDADVFGQRFRGGVDHD